MNFYFIFAAGIQRPISKYQLNCFPNYNPLNINVNKSKQNKWGEIKLIQCCNIYQNGKLGNRESGVLL